MPMSPRTLRPANSFSPKAIPGLLAWLDASDPSSYTVSTGVSEWRDKSGNNRTFAQSTGNNQPAVTTLSSGKTVFTFDGTNDSLTSQTSLSLSSTHSVFAVVLPRIRKIGSFLAGSQGAELIYGDGSASFSGSKFGAFGVARAVYGGGDITTAVRQIVSAVCSGSTMPTDLSMWTNGVGGPVSVVTAGSDLTAAMTTPLTIGTSSGNQFWDGQIAEILIYGNAVSTTRRGSIERWLGGKWGIAVS
jgi:hypothetical protein